MEVRAPPICFDGPDGKQRNASSLEGHDRSPLNFPSRPWRLAGVEKTSLVVVSSWKARRVSAQNRAL